MLSKSGEENIQLLPAEQALLAGSLEMQQGLYKNRLGYDYTWFSPYLDKEGAFRAVIAIGYSSKFIFHEILDAFIADIIPFLLSLSLGLLILLLLVRQRIVDPIHAISDSMNLFAKNSRHKPESVNIPGGDEIGDIAASYEKMTDDISSYVGSIEALTREQVENNVQMELACRIQYGMVPPKTILNGKGFCLTDMTRPAKEVGGDFYDCFQRSDNSVCIVMGDVSGKGVTAAIFMAMIKTIIREKLIVGLSPAEVLNQTNDEICSQNPENLFATAFVGVLDPVTGELRYANAGHNYPVLLKKNTEYLKPDPGIALGMFEDSGITDNVLYLKPREGILLYTDGVTEAVNPKKEFFGEGRLLEAVKSRQDESNTADGVILAVSRAVAVFCEGNEQFDDMAALALFREDGQNESIGKEDRWHPL